MTEKEVNTTILIRKQKFYFSVDRFNEEATLTEAVEKEHRKQVRVEANYTFDECSYYYPGWGWVIKVA